MRLLSITILITASLDAVQGWRALLRGCEPPNEPQGTVTEFVTDTSPSFCLIVEDSDAENDKPLILGECNLLGQAWKYDNGLLFRTTLDENLCMQAGCHGEDPTHGTQMRLAPCDMEKQRQQFDWYISTIKLKGTNLCVSYRGSAAQDHDPILLKECDENDPSGAWSRDDPND